MSSTWYSLLDWPCKWQVSDTDNDQIIEVATIVTDDNLNILAEASAPFINMIVCSMRLDEWNTRPTWPIRVEVERVRAAS